MKRSAHATEKLAVAQKSTTDSKYYDLMSLLFLTAYLIIDFLPYLQRTEIINIQFLYITVLNIIVSLFIYNNQLLYTQTPVNLFKRSYVFKAYILFILLAGLSVFAARNVSLGINALAQLTVIFGMIVNVTVLLYNRLYLLYKIVFVVGVCALLQAFQALIDYKQVIGHFSFAKAINKIVTIEGNTGNMNIFSASLMAKIPFLLLGITYFKNWKKWILIVALLLSTFLIFLINAKASLVSLIVIYFFFILYYFKTYRFKRSSWYAVTSVLWPLLISLMLVNYTFSKNSESKRYVSVVERLGQINAKESSITARLMFWEIAVNFTKSNPLLGIGLDNWRVESIPHEKLQSLIVSLHTHNDFLQLFAETGVVNGLIYLSIFIALLSINGKRILKPVDPKQQLIALLAFMLLTVYGIDALFNFPLYRPTMQLCFCFVIALTLLNISSIIESKAVTNKKWLPVTLIIITVTPLYFTYYADKTSQLEYKIVADQIDFKKSGNLKGDDIVNQNLLLPNVLSTSASFYGYAGIYFLRQKKYDKALKYLDEANKINPYLGRPDFYKYVMSVDRNMPDSAAHYIKSAFNIYPNNNDFYNAAMSLNKYIDTTEVLAMYKRRQDYGKSAEIWDATMFALQNRNYNPVKLKQLLDRGLNDFPSNTKVKETYNNITITGHILRGQKLFASGKNQEALRAYQEALKIDSTNVFALQNTGFYYYNMRKPQEAIPYLLKALQKPGLTGGKTEYFLGWCYINVNDQHHACVYFNMAKALHYPDAQARFDQYCK